VLYHIYHVCDLSAQLMYASHVANDQLHACLNDAIQLLYNRIPPTPDGRPVPVGFTTIKAVKGYLVSR
jgi:hypothetical protein